MTIAITLKVNDGLVLAADSASTIVAVDDAGNTTLVNIYNHANKVFNLIKGKPIGAMTWGGGNIGTASMSTLMKDLRQILAGERDGPNGECWAIGDTYSVAKVAELAKRFFYDDHYAGQFKDAQSPFEIGIVVAGYADGESLAEEYEILMTAGSNCLGPRPIRQRPEAGITWYGQGEPITRLILGYSGAMPMVLATDLNVPEDQREPIMLLLQQKLQAPVISPAMPIQDAIDLAEFLVQVAINYARFMPGPQTVGGPIEIAAITKHEGFKWIQRKHYYSRALNPLDGRERNE